MSRWLWRYGAALLGLLIAGALAVGGIALAHSGALSRHKVEQQAVRLYNEANHQASRRPECKLPPPPPMTISHGSPSAALLSILGILRRPATPEDALPSQGVDLPFVQDVFVDYVRVAHAADGREYYIVPAGDARAGLPVESHACLSTFHRTLLRVLRGKPARVRRRALHFYAERARNDRRVATRGPQEGVFMFARGPHGLGSGGGGADAAFLETHGMFGSSGQRDGSSVVSGLVPDGVATVTSTFQRVYSRGLGHRPAVYPSVIRRTDPVQDNVVSFAVARSAEDALASRMVWRAADGSVVRVISEPH